MVLKRLREDLADCLCERCQRGRCVLSLQGFSKRRIVVDGDKYQALFGHKSALADFLVIWQSGKIGGAVCEMKAGFVDAHHVIDQLQGGATVLEGILDGEDVGPFYPILAHGKGLNTMEIRILRNSRIRFRGRPYPAIPARCGGRLTQLPDGACHR